MNNDVTLLRRFAESGSESAFAELVRRHVSFVYSIALRQVGGNVSVAKDVTQIVFTDLSRKAREISDHEVLTGWLYTAARFAAAKALRSESRRSAVTQKAQFTLTMTLSEGSAVDWDRLSPVLDVALDALKERERTAVLLRFYEKKTFAEIGVLLALNESAARSCVNRALDKLQSALARQGVSSTAAALSLVLAEQTGIAAPAGLAATIVSATLTAVGGTSALTAVLGTLNFMSTLKVGGALVALIAAGIPAAFLLHRSSEPSISSSVTQGSQQSLPIKPNDRDQKEIGVGADRGPSNLPTKTEDHTSTSPASFSRQDAQKDDEEVQRAARQKARQQARQTQKKEVRKEEKLDANRMAKIREKTSQRLGPLFQKINLTPEQQGKLIKLVIDDREAGLDFAAARARVGDDLTQDPDAYWIATFELRNDTQDRIKSLLGDSGYAEFLLNDFNVRQSVVVEVLQKLLQGSPAELTDEQGKRLLTTLNEFKTYQIDDAVIADAANFLSPPQMEALLTVRSRQTSGTLKPIVQKTIRANLGKTPGQK